MKKLLKSWAINSIAVLVAVKIVPGIRLADDGVWTLLVTSLVLGILNAFLRPILTFLTLPLMIVTLGLFRLVINALLLYFVSLLLGRYFAVDSFGAAFFGALIISIISMLLNLVIGGSRARGHAEHQRHVKGPPGGSGPVIDV